MALQSAPDHTAYQVEATRKLFEDLLHQKVLRASHSPYASPLVLVAKKDGSTRPCVDYRRLDAQTVPDAYPLPRIDDLITRANGNIFTTLDLKNGYYQIPVTPADVSKTAVTTPFGLFEYLRMPFGLRNAAPTFQRLMDFVLRGLPGVFVYIDDILIVADTWEEHLHRLAATLGRLRDAGLRINGNKSIWCVPEVCYLGFLISQQGYRPLPSRVSALEEQQPPRNSKDLRRILGMLNFYRAPRFAFYAAPLYPHRHLHGIQHCKSISISSSTD